MSDVEFVENLAPPATAKALRSRASKYAIDGIKIDGALLVPIGAKSEKGLRSALYGAVRNYRKTNPAANFTIARYDTPAGIAHIGVFRTADSAPAPFQTAAE